MSKACRCIYKSQKAQRTRNSTQHEPPGVRFGLRGGPRSRPQTDVCCKYTALPAVMVCPMVNIHTTRDQTRKKDL